MNAQLEEAYAAGVMAKLAEYGLEELGGDDVFWSELDKVAQTNDLSHAAPGGPYYNELLRRNKEIEAREAAKPPSPPGPPQPTAGNQFDTDTPKPPPPRSNSDIINYFRGQGLVNKDGTKFLPVFLRENIDKLRL